LLRKTNCKAIAIIAAMSTATANGQRRPVSGITYHIFFGGACW
jgi:hypothetical protein